MRLPDFIIAGAARSGTTWLYQLLDRHPEVGMAKPLKPEPKFFLQDALYGRGLDYYSTTWFKDQPGRRLGEKSTNYLDDPKVAPRIRRDLPAVKLIFILRDPIERAWSNYRWSVMNGLESESFAFAIAHEQERELPEKYRQARPFSYIARGLYADLLAPYLALFPQEQLLILRFEEILAAPKTLARRLHRFIGVDERSDDAASMGMINEARGTDGPIPEDCRTRLTEIFAEPNHRLARLVGQDFSGWS